MLLRGQTRASDVCKSLDFCKPVFDPHHFKAVLGRPRVSIKSVIKNKWATHLAGNYFVAEGDDSELIPPSGPPGGKYGRAALNALGGLVPFVGGVCVLSRCGHVVRGRTGKVK
jgi:hypothetical protein